MGKLLKDESGFSVVEITLIGVIAVLIVLVGWLIYKDNHKTTTTTTKTAATTTTTTKSAPQSNPAQVLQRQEYIDTYINANTSQNYTAAYYTSLYSKGYITKSEHNVIQAGAGKYTVGSATDTNANPAYIKLVCVNNLPSSYIYTLPIISSNSKTATVMVTEDLSNNSSTPSFTANWVNNNGVWQLNNVNCTT